MKPWVGAVAVAAAILAAPSVALAGEDDPAQLQFKLPSAEAVHDFETLGAHMDHGVTTNADGTRRRQRVGDRRAGSRCARAHGYEPVGTWSRASTRSTRIRAERNATLAEIKAAKRRAARRTPAGKKGKSAAPGDIRAAARGLLREQRRPLPLDRGQRRRRHLHRHQRQRPTAARPSWPSGLRRRAATASAARRPSASTATPTSARTTTSTTTRSSGSATRATARPVPASIKVSSSNGDVDTLAVKEWVAKNPPKPTRPAEPASSRTTTTRKRRTRRCATSPPSSRTSPRPSSCRRRRVGYQRRAQTMLGYTNATGTGPTATVGYVRFDANNLPVAGATPTTAPAGRHGRPDLEEPGPPGRQQPHGADRRSGDRRGQPGAERQPHRQRDPRQSRRPTRTARSPAPRRRSSPRSTPTRRSPTLVTRDAVPHEHRRRRRAARRGLAAERPAARPGRRSRAARRTSTCCASARCATAPRSACSSTARSTATRSRPRASASRPRSASCATTGPMPETTALVDNLDIFIIPQINGDGATHSLYDSNRRKNLSNHCEDTAKFPAKNTDPANRNSWGVDMNRNFTVGSIFDGFQGASATDCSSGNFAGLVRALRARGAQRDLGADDVPQHQVRQQHPLVRWLLHVAARRLHAGARAAAVPAVRHAELLRPDRQDRPRRHQVAPRHGDPCRSRPARSSTCSTRPPATPRTRRTTRNGIIGFDFEIGTTNYYKNPTTGVEATCGAGQQPPFGDSTNDCLDNEGFHEAMEFASGNYGLLQAAMDYGNDTTAPVVDGDRQVRRQRRRRTSASRATRRRRSTTRPTARRRPRPPPSGSRSGPGRCRCRSRSPTTRR